MSALTSKLYRWDCPTTQEISDYAAGRLRGKRRHTLALHFKRCPHCTEELEISRQFLSPAPQAAAAPGLRSPAANLQPLPPRQRLVARLLPHRTAGAALAGIRGSSSQGNEGWPRQYQFDTISLSLHRAVPPAGGSGSMLLGLISRAEAPPDAFSNIEIHLLLSDAPDKPPLATEQIDDLGNFVLSPVPTGRFDLLIVLPEGDLVIEGLELSG
jgi:hypothetical protein